MKTTDWRLLPFVIFVVLAGFLWRGLSLDPQHLPSVKLGKALPEFALPSLNDREERLTPSVMHGKTVLLNVWASWCSACTQEQVFLMALARQGVEIYGLNYKDDGDHARQWLQEWGNPYRMTGADLQGRVAIDLGVYGAPETFLIDRTGVIRHRHAGILTAEVWQREFVPLMNALEKA